MTAVRGMVAVAVLLAAAPVAAQPGVLLHASFETTTFAAERSFEAVAGTSSVEGPSFGVTFTRLWRGAFVDALAARRTLAGERVFVHGGAVFRLGIPATIEWRPFDLAAGWRVAVGRWRPYAGAGLTNIVYKETAAFAQAGDDVTASRAGTVILAGVDVVVWRGLAAGAEVRHRAVRGVFGTAGVSEVFNEDRLGGTSAAVRVSWSFGR